MLTEFKKAVGKCLDCMCSWASGIQWKSALSVHVCQFQAGMAMTTHTYQHQAENETMQQPPMLSNFCKTMRYCIIVHSWMFQQGGERVWHLTLPSCANRISGECETDVCQCFHTQEEFQLFPASPADAFKLANKFPSHIVQMFFILLFFFLFWLDLGISESSCEPFKMGI